MKAKFIVAIALVAALVGFAVGWKLGHISAGVAKGTNPQAGNSASSSSGPPAESSVSKATILSNQFLTVPEVEQALKELAKLNGPKRWQRVQALSERIDTDDIPELMAKLTTFPPGPERLIRNLLLERWGAADPQAALRFADTIKDANERRAACYQVLRGWMEKDISSAVAWAKQLPPGPRQIEAIRAVVPALAETDSEAALAMLEPLEGRGQIPYSFRDLFEQWSLRDPAAAAVRAAELKIGIAARWPIAR